MAITTIDGTWERVRWTTDGRSVGHAASINTLADRLAKPQAIVCEPAFYDGLREVRNVLRDSVAERGHRLVVVNPGARAVLEAAAGGRSSGSGVIRLHSIVVAGASGLDWQIGRGHDRWGVRDAIDVLQAIDTVHETANVAALAIAAVGPYADLDESGQFALGDGQGYRLDVLLAVYRAASVATSRDDFERFLGLTAGPSGSAVAHTIRSWRSLRNATMLERDPELTWSEYRRALRACFHRVASERHQRGGAVS